MFYAGENIGVGGVGSSAGNAIAIQEDPRVVVANDESRPEEIDTFVNGKVEKNHKNPYANPPEIKEQNTTLHA